MKTKILQSDINKIMENSKFEIFHRVFEKQCVVVAKLPNGFTVIGEAACVDPNNYDEQIGEELAKERVMVKIWELEGYKLQNDLSKI
jgi:hypothetical protein